ncbi:hypothetical protein QTI66_25815 [Variovorax sp. J22R133]|uniref:hypothetical protein n=1 Tax=Variovorax brevis TaxID=3053503 RepID=UPI00257734E1|nr:hypothetical protein [Variovorax sp. J22R133]MDM0115593.1 hypothetical protein [Variovorax sp. J22R133]
MTFDYVPNTDGALNYAATSKRPVRGASIEVVDDATHEVLVNTTSDEAGRYAATVPSNAVVSIRVKAQMLRKDAGATWDVTVRDNTRGNAIYAMESAAFRTQGTATARDVHAPSGWGGSHYTSQRVAAPFAILDTIYTTMNKVTSVASGLDFPKLRVLWSERNVAGDGSVELGQIGTTSFSDDPTGPVIYVLGKEDVDTDEYDASVIAHEWGHYYQKAFSRDDSPGGSHGADDRLDRRVAFSEGWGNAWSGIALGRSTYADSAGIGQSQDRGTVVDLSAGPSSAPGWFKEASSQSILWALNAQWGFQAIHNAMAGPLRTTPGVTSIHAFATAYAAAFPSGTGTLMSALGGQSISAMVGDPWGMQETNDGGIPEVLPLYRPAAVGVPTSACVTQAAGTGNRLGNFTYLRFTVPASGIYQVTATGPAGSDPDFSIYAGSRMAASEGSGASESAQVSLPQGEAVLVLNDAAGTSANTCFTVTIN